MQNVSFDNISVKIINPKKAGGDAFNRLSLEKLNGAKSTSGESTRDNTYKRAYAFLIALCGTIPLTGDKSVTSGFIQRNVLIVKSTDSGDIITGITKAAELNPETIKTLADSFAKTGTATFNYAENFGFIVTRKAEQPAKAPVQTSAKTPAKQPVKAAKKAEKQKIKA